MHAPYITELHSRVLPPGSPVAYDLLPLIRYHARLSTKREFSSGQPSTTIKDDQRQWETIGAVLSLPPVAGVGFARIPNENPHGFGTFLTLHLYLNKRLTMPRLLIIENAVHPSIRQKIADNHVDVVQQVTKAIHQHPVVVVGMAGNPMVGKARKALDAAGVKHEYLAFGSYFSQWRRRNALKMWSGWPTFPMVFVHGVLIGGADDLQQLVDSGELKDMLAK